MIEFQNIKKFYPNGTHALNGVNLTIRDGEFVFVMGRTGAGKSTLVKLLLGEEKPTSGKLTVDSHDLSRISRFRLPYYRRSLGVVFQDFRLFPKKTVYENVAFAMRAVGTPGYMIRRRVPAILSTVNLAHKINSFPHELSGGEQQRVALARALANNPKIILADEPTGNIDPEMTQEIMSILLGINRLGKTIIVVTHEQEMASLYKQRTIMLEGGQVTRDYIGGEG